MFDNLIESKRKAQKSFKQSVISVGVHAGIIALAIKVTQGAAANIREILQDTTMVFLEPPKAPPPETPPPDMVVSANPPPQGFQLVVPPDNIPTEIPPVDLNQRFDPKDFTGKGVEGGIGAGVVGGTGPVPTIEGEVFLAAEVDEVPSAVSGPKPRYPPVMEQAGIPGDVTMQFVVDTTGHVEAASFKIVASSHKSFEEPAREALLKYIFKPGRSHGKPVRVLVQQKIAFKAGQ